MKIRLYNAKILTMANGENIINGELWTDDDKISYLGSFKPSYEKFDREIDVKGNLLMPGFKNAHTHSAMTFARSYADDFPLHEWLFDKIFPLEAKLTPDYVYTFTKLAFLEYLTSGITADFDMYMFSDAVAAATVDTGFRTVLCGSVDGDASRINQLHDSYNKFNNMDSRITYRLGFHAEYTCKKDLLREIGILAGTLKQPVFTHNSETQKEVTDCIERHGKTPTELFDSLGIYDFGGGGFHCVHMSDNDFNIFKKHGLFAVTNPASNCKLASGIAPIGKMIEQGIKVAIGTDGAASNNSLDMFREMFLVTALQKIVAEDASACDAYEVLKMSTVNGADAMGLDNCNCLKAGKKADIIEIDLSQPNMQPINNIAKNIVYSGSKSNVKMTMIEGKVLYENGEFFIGEDPEKIYQNANLCMKKMLTE